LVLPFDEREGGGEFILVEGRVEINKMLGFFFFFLALNPDNTCGLGLRQLVLNRGRRVGKENYILWVVLGHGAFVAIDTLTG
jgi:hypothetical protein